MEKSTLIPFLRPSLDILCVGLQTHLVAHRRLIHPIGDLCVMLREM
jgi:hypothetical protein